jgi:hypothetical protein
VVLTGCRPAHQEPDTRLAWKTFTSKSGKFSALFPGTPKQSITPQPTVAGKIDVHSFIVETDAVNAFGINYSDFPETLNLSNPGALFDGAQTTTAGERGAIVTQQTMKFKGYPAREFEFKPGGKANYSGRVRLILVGRRIYSLVVIFLTANPHPEERTKFFESFSVGGQNKNSNTDRVAVPDYLSVMISAAVQF